MNPCDEKEWIRQVSGKIDFRPCRKATSRRAAGRRTCSIVKRVIAKPVRRIGLRYEYFRLHSGQPVASQK